MHLTKILPTSLYQVNKITILSVMSMAILLSGCQTSRLFNKVDDGSLAYTKAQQLEPIKLPADQKTAPFIPLYPTPAVGSNTLKLKNEDGVRYELPKPYRKTSTQTP